jgi:hypothetical protein
MTRSETFWLHRTQVSWRTQTTVGKFKFIITFKKKHFDFTYLFIDYTIKTFSAKGHPITYGLIGINGLEVTIDSEIVLSGLKSSCCQQDDDYNSADPFTCYSNVSFVDGSSAKEIQDKKTEIEGLQSALDMAYKAHEEKEREHKEELQSLRYTFDEIIRQERKYCRPAVSETTTTTSTTTTLSFTTLITTTTSESTELKSSEYLNMSHEGDIENINSHSTVLESLLIIPTGSVSNTDVEILPKEDSSILDLDEDSSNAANISFTSEDSPDLLQNLEVSVIFSNLLQFVTYFFLLDTCSIQQFVPRRQDFWIYNIKSFCGR